MFKKEIEDFNIKKSELEKEIEDRKARKARLFDDKKREKHSSVAAATLFYDRIAV